MTDPGRLIPADALNARLREIWDWAASMIPRSGSVSTYGCDAVGKCIELVDAWPDESCLASIRIHAKQREVPRD
jgi:hypothetical protein